jgi:glucokinase
MGSGHAPILSELVQGDATRVTPLQMSIAADNGDDSVSNAIQHAVEYLGIGIANAVSITAVETVVLGGGLSALGERLLGPVRKAILNRVKMFPSEHVKVRVSSLGENAGALGAAVLTMIESKRLESTALRCNYGDRR